ncbi:MAG: hypothetical protein EOL97_15930 [Spirochaetia bacterium]|nr:hypothetical protein [Spirochaetia bacterium]
MITLCPVFQANDLKQGFKAGLVLTEDCGTLAWLGTDKQRELKKDLERIAGNWNGDESGLQEEEAMEALELLEVMENKLDPFKDEEHNELLDEKLQQEYMEDRKQDLIDLEEMDENSGD